MYTVFVIVIHYTTFNLAKVQKIFDIQKSTKKMLILRNLLKISNLFLWALTDSNRRPSACKAELGCPTTLKTN